MGRSKKNAGTWLLTYSDLVTLLMVFFLMLYMLTGGVDQQTFTQFIVEFQGQKNVMEQPAVMDADLIPKEDLQQETMQNLTDFVKDNRLEDQIILELMFDGIRISLSEEITFNSGSADLIPAARVLMSQIVQLFDEKIREVEVQGHTDNIPLSPSSYYPTNWDLGAGRATSMVKFLVENGELGPEKYKASSYGEFQPLSPNTTEQGRRLNRRVEIYLRFNNADNTNVNNYQL
jgi:chemotaxis protein MotB